MPNYPWLADNKVDPAFTKDAMRVMKTMGVPYTADDIAAADEIAGKSEMEAIVAYLQVLGTMVKFEDKDYRQ